MARASPMASAAVVDDVGARFIGHASSATLTSSTTSHWRASVEPGLPVRSTIGTPSRLSGGRIASTSSVSPEFESASTTSPRATMPRSPCTPSAGCRKYAGVPVDARVAAILRPTRPDLPMPVTMTRPAQPRSVSTARAKPASSLGTRARIASASSRRTRSAMRRRSGPLICLSGGPEMAPRPPALGRAPAQPWRASGTRPQALGGAPAQPWRASGTRPPALGRAPAPPWRASGTRPPALGRAPAPPWRASGTQDVSSCPPLGVHPVDREQLVEQARQHVDPQHVRPVRERPAVGQRAVGVFVHLHEERVDAERHRGAREGRDVLALATRAVPRPARQLHRVRGVEDDRVAELAHVGQAAHIDHEVVIAERRPPLGQQYRLVALREDLG